MNINAVSPMKLDSYESVDNTSNNKQPEGIRKYVVPSIQRPGHWKIVTLFNQVHLSLPSLKFAAEIPFFEFDSFEDSYDFILYYGKDKANQPNSFVESVKFDNKPSCFVLKKTKEKQFVLEINASHKDPRTVYRFFRDFFGFGTKVKEYSFIGLLIIKDQSEIQRFLTTLVKNNLLPSYAVDLLSVSSFGDIKTISDAKQAYLKKKQEKEADAKMRKEKEKEGPKYKPSDAEIIYINKLKKLEKGEIDYEDLF